LLIGKSFLAYHAKTNKATIKKPQRFRCGFLLGKLVSSWPIAVPNAEVNRMSKHARRNVVGPDGGAKLKQKPGRFSGDLAVGALTSKMGVFDLAVDSMVLAQNSLAFELSGLDGSGNFNVHGVASFDPAADHFVCPVALVCYVSSVVPPIPTRFEFSVRDVTADGEALCFLSLRWEEDEWNDWIAFGLLGVAKN
jgi:hypothetical protein